MDPDDDDDGVPCGIEVRAPSGATDGRDSRDGGSAIVDFALVGGLLTLLFVAVLQLALVLHVRNTLIDCADQGAQFGALADRDPALGAARTRELIRADLTPGYARDVTAADTRIDGLDTVEVRVRAPLPVIGLFGRARTISVSGHALAQAPVP